MTGRQVCVLQQAFTDLFNSFVACIQLILALKKKNSIKQLLFALLIQLKAYSTVYFICLYTFPTKILIFFCLTVVLWEYNPHDNTAPNRYSISHYKISLWGWRPMILQASFMACREIYGLVYAHLCKMTASQQTHSNTVTVVPPASSLWIQQLCMLFTTLGCSESFACYLQSSTQKCYVVVSMSIIRSIWRPSVVA